MEGHQYTEATLIESLQALKRSIRRLENLMSLDKGIGFYESEVERERKYHTKRNIKRSL